MIRRSYPELRENHILPLSSATLGAAEYKSGEKTLIFKNKSKIKFGYLSDDGDVLQYQGQEFDVIFIDEATQISEYQYAAVTACLRGVNDLPKRIYITCNPGGVGHSWVKRLFIDRDFKESESAKDYKFIPAKIFDNVALLKKDPNYLKSLNALPEEMKKAWLYGEWNIFSGQYFSEWNSEVHIIEPFSLPESWRKYAALDYGLDMLACYFFAVDSGGRAVVYREIYRSGLIVSAAAKEILENMGEENIYQFFAPPDLWNRHSDSGKSTAEIFEDYGITLCKAANDRVQGWYNLKEWLKVYEDEKGELSADLKIFKNCKNLIRTLPQIQYDARNPNDTATNPHELTHAPDAVRYFIAGRPAPSSGTPPVKKQKLIDKILKNGGIRL